ncbi:hypothetical protein SDC9_143812 [bioreactor metagenome]|uniref:Uncharacterized protein n=1 Tax=bioreactor metagenome TaxID=1076179 RepID=A0A645E4K4_9ZZZZ
MERKVVGGGLGGPFPVHHRNGRGSGNLEALSHEGEGHLGNNDHGGTVLLGEIEGPDGEVEGLLDR